MTARDMTPVEAALQTLVDHAVEVHGDDFADYEGGSSRLASDARLRAHVEGALRVALEEPEFSDASDIVLSEVPR